MTSPNSKSAAQGVSEAWDFWLSQHPVTVSDLIDTAVRGAVSDWLDRHTDEIIEAVARRMDPGA